MKTYKNQIYPTGDVIGIIMPHHWDENGRVIQVAIYTNKEEVYLVEHNQKEKELLNYINKRVAVKGEILTRNDTGQLVFVKNFLILAEDADDENDIT
jgi:DNA polymerase elongation subunit (family B)